MRHGFKFSVNRQPVSGGYGYTLAEILIVIGLLAVVSAMGVSMLRGVDHTKRKKAVFQQTISMLSAAFTRIEEENLVSTGSDFDALLSGQLETVVYCGGDPISSGCWESSMGVPDGGGALDDVAFILQNGAYVASFGRADTDSRVSFSGSDPFVDFFIDWNGTSGPNTLGEDQMEVKYCFNRTCTGPGDGYNGNRSGMIYPINDTDTTSITLFNEIYGVS